MVLISTITNCHCSTTLACSLHRGKGVHFLRLRFLNRSMWKNFFPAVISKNPWLGSRSRIFVFYGTNLYGQTGVGFPRWLCQHIIFWTLCQICHRGTIRYTAFQLPMLYGKVEGNVSVVLMNITYIVSVALTLILVTKAPFFFKKD